MHTILARTRGGSTYLIGPGSTPGRLRVARVGSRPVRGTIGPLSFAWEVDRVELTPATDGVRLRVSTADGSGFETTEVVHIEPCHLPGADDPTDPATDTMPDTVSGTVAL